MRVYLDSSALVKRVVSEPDADQLRSQLAQLSADGAALICSSLGWIEVTRALRAQLAALDDSGVNDFSDAAMSGILERPMSSEVVGLARRLGPSSLRTLDAIHLASALLTDVDVVIAYDGRLLDAARQHSLSTLSPHL